MLLAPAVEAQVEDRRVVRVAGVELQDNGDNDGWADWNETVTLRLAFLNATGSDLTGVRAQLSTDDPSIECITDPVVYVGDLASWEKRWTDGDFEFKVGTVERTALNEDLSATFEVTFFADGFREPMPFPDRFTLDLDLDTTGGTGASTWFEGFEGGFGSFTTMHLDETLNPPDSDLANRPAGVENADGYRCPYHDPEFAPGSGQQCYPSPDGEGDAYYWHANDDRSFSGMQSLHWGAWHSGANDWTTPTAQLEAARTTDPINLDWGRRCSITRTTVCVADADCPPEESCEPGGPTLSFKHQISLVDDRLCCVAGPTTTERAVVQIQVADENGLPAGPWTNVEPYRNPYETVAYTGPFNCTFDPIDDGNTEDDVTDPQGFPRSGPSSTCWPAPVFADQGATGGAYAPSTIGDAPDGPGLAGESGPGTWVEVRADLSRWRGHRVRLRFLTSGVKFPSFFVLWEDWLQDGPDPRDDGWFVDDVRIDGTLVDAATVSIDTQDNSGLPGLADDDLDGVACDNCALLANADQLDVDTDGVGDVCDACPADPGNDADGDGLCCGVDLCCDAPDPDQADADGDAVGDACDNCPSIANALQTDEVHPGGPGDACDDPDGDGLVDATDLCPDLSTTDQTDTDSDSVGDACDNCTAARNASRGDRDLDGAGDVCDSCPDLTNLGDTDGDGVDDACDLCPGVFDPAQLDGDRDGVGDACARCPSGDGSDDDDDGIPCSTDNCPAEANPDQADQDGDGAGDSCDLCPVDAFDLDGDTLCGAADPCPRLQNSFVDTQSAGDFVASVMPPFEDLSSFALSPDGLSVAYLSERGLTLSRLAGGPHRRLRPSWDAELFGGGVRFLDIRFAPDGRAVFFRDDRRIYRIRLDNGTVDELAHVPEGSAILWHRLTSDSRRLVYSALDPVDPPAARFVAIDLADDSPSSLLALPIHTSTRNLELSPEGQWLLFDSDLDSHGEFRTSRISVAGGPVARLDVPLRRTFTPDGTRVVFFSMGSLYAVDLDTFAEPWPLIDPPLAEDVNGFSFTVTPDSNHVIFSAALPGEPASVFRVSMEGGPATLLASGIDSIDRLMVTPDGATVISRAWEEDADGDALYRVPIDGGVPVQIRSPIPFMEALTLSPDGKHLIYRWLPSGRPWQFESVPVAGGPPKTIGALYPGAPVFTPDGSTVVFRSSTSNTDTRYGLYVAPVAAPVDRDGDGVIDSCDDCPDDPDPIQADLDGDGIGDPCDPDADGDGLEMDNCPLVANVDQADGDADGAGDPCDNCPVVANPGQTDIDGDLVGNRCDLDDGFLDLLFSAPDTLAWQAEAGATSWMVYRGSLTVLRDGGSYTQAFGTNAIANRWCGLPVPSLDDEFDPPDGAGVAFYLVAVRTGPYAGDLGTDSDGVPRPNTLPCP